MQYFVCLFALLYFYLNVSSFAFLKTLLFHFLYFPSHLNILSDVTFLLISKNPPCILLEKHQWKRIIHFKLQYIYESHLLFILLCDLVFLQILEFLNKFLKFSVFFFDFVNSLVLRPEMVKEKSFFREHVTSRVLLVFYS